MGNLRLSIHSNEHSYLRQLLLKQRQHLGLSQRELGNKLGVVHSLVGKIETGDRRLDVFEFIEYCKSLNLDPVTVLSELQDKFSS